MWLTDLLGVCSLIASLAVFYHGDVLSGYMLVLIGYLLFITAANESEISRMKAELTKIGKRHPVEIKRRPNLTVS